MAGLHVMATTDKSRRQALELLKAGVLPSAQHGGQLAFSDTQASGPRDNLKRLQQGRALPCHTVHDGL